MYTEHKQFLASVAITTPNCATVPATTQAKAVKVWQRVLIAVTDRDS